MTERQKSGDDISRNSGDADPKGVTEDVGFDGQVFQQQLGVRVLVRNKLFIVQLRVKVLTQLAIISSIPMQGMQAVAYVLDTIQDITQADKTLYVFRSPVVIPVVIQRLAHLSDTGR